MRRVMGRRCVATVVSSTFSHNGTKLHASIYACSWHRPGLLAVSCLPAFAKEGPHKSAHNRPSPCGERCRFSGLGPLQGAAHHGAESHYGTKLHKAALPVDAQKSSWDITICLLPWRSLPCDDAPYESKRDTPRPDRRVFYFIGIILPIEPGPERSGDGR